MTISKHAYPCILCPEHFEKKSEQADHLATSHSYKQPWLCHQCPNCFEDEDDLDNHESIAHPTPDANHETCIIPACGLHFASEKMLVRHRKHDHTQQAARMGKGLGRGCDNRGCQYTNDSCVAYSVHMLHQHQLKCTTCRETFESFSELVKHREGPGKNGKCAPKPTLEPKATVELPANGLTSVSMIEIDRNEPPGEAAGQKPETMRPGLTDSILQDEIAGQAPEERDTSNLYVGHRLGEQASATSPHSYSRVELQVQGGRSSQSLSAH